MTAPVPVEKRRATGNWRERKPPAVLVIEGTVDRVPEPPEDLGAHGRKRWTEVWSVADKWLVPTLDLGILVAYCAGFDERAYWQALIRKEGRMSRGSVGQPKVHPAVQEMHALDERLTRWASELGFTPVGRARLHVEKRPKPPERKLDKYLGAAASG